MTGILGARAAFCATAAALAAVVNLSWFGPGWFAGLLILGAAAAAWLAGGAARRMGGRTHGWRAVAGTGVIYTLVVAAAFGGWAMTEDARAAREGAVWYEFPLFALGISPFVAVIVVPAVLAGGALFQVAHLIVARGWLRAAAPGLVCLALAGAALAVLIAAEPEGKPEQPGGEGVGIAASLMLLAGLVGLVAWAGFLLVRLLRGRTAAGRA